MFAKLFFFGLVLLQSSVKTAYRRAEHTGLARHFSAQEPHHHHHHHHLPQTNRDPSSHFNLSEGVSSVLSQLLPSCSTEKQFRALNLDITCPPSLPTVTSCYCLTKNKDGQLLSKLSGKIDYQGRCKCESSRARSSSWEHVITRSSCCTTVTRGTSDTIIAANTAEEPAGIVYCPPESPYKTKYRSTAGVVRCGGDRLVGKCLCLTERTRSLGTVLGSHCICKGSGGKSKTKIVVRAVCCSDDSQDETGETVITQSWT